jgi:hypothetical protein
MTGHDEYLERPEREDLRLGAPGEGCPAKAASDIMSWANRPNHLPALHPHPIAEVSLWPTVVRLTFFFLMCHAMHSLSENGL